MSAVVKLSMIEILAQADIGSLSTHDILCSSLFCPLSANVQHGYSIRLYIGWQGQSVPITKTNDLPCIQGINIKLPSQCILPRDRRQSLHLLAKDSNTQKSSV